MKQRSQETTPLWVWFSLGLLVIAIIAYAVGFLMFEQSTRTEILGPLTLSAEEQTVRVTPRMRRRSDYKL